MGAVMPHYSYLATGLNCPTCGSEVSDLVYFQWGFSPGYSLREDQLYYVGDPIRWQATKDGAILPWVYFWRRRGDRIVDQGSNLGDPAIRNLVVRDVAQFFWLQPEERRRCEACNAVLEGAIVEIRDGTIQGAQIYQPGEYGIHADVYIVDPSGALKPMPEWVDYPMGIVYDLLPEWAQ